jgi:hypothetical protein
VDNDSPDGGHWWGLEDLQELGYMEHDELVTIELSYLKRGTGQLAFSLLRLDFSLQMYVQECVCVLVQEV